MKKRIISLMLVICMILTAFIGCGKKDKDEETNVGGSGKLTVGVPQNANVTDYNENGFTKYIEEALGIELEFVYFSSSSTEYQKQITLMCTSGERLPDVLWGFYGMDRYTVNEFGEDGYFQDLTELLEKKAPNYQAMLEKIDPQIVKNIKSRGTSSIDGGFYGMPLVSAMKTVDTLSNITYINKTWLDKLGMKIPTTTDELYSVLKAFKTKDPNGNGQNDEIPILSSQIEGYIINAFVYTGTYGFNVTDGKVWNPYTTNEYRKALQFCKKLCDEKLLDDLNFTLTSQAEYTSLITPANDVARVGIWQGHPQLVTSTSSKILDEYVALQPLADATGKGGYIVEAPMDLAFCSFITEDCKDVDTAMKFMDFFYLDETITCMRHGVKDVDWVYEDGINDYGNPSKFKLLNTNAAFQGNSTWGTLGHGIRTEENFITSSNDGLSERNKEAARMFSETYKIQTTWKQPKEILANLNYTVAEYEQRNKLSTLYNQYVGESRALFITGDMDINNDSVWNDYVKQIKDLGEDTLMNIAQSAYDRELKQK